MRHHICVKESECCSVMSDSWRPHRLHSPWNSPGQNTGVGSLSLLQGIFPTQGSNPDLPHCRRILYQLSHQGSPVCSCKKWKKCLPAVQSESEVTQSCPTLCDPMDCSLPHSSIRGIFQARVLEWVAISFSRGSSWPRDWTQVSCIVGRRFNLGATREVQRSSHSMASTKICHNLSPQFFFYGCLMFHEVLCTWLIWPS